MMIKERIVGMLGNDGHGCVRTEPLSELKKGFVLVKVHASLISPGTELSAARQTLENHSAPEGPARRFGYQNAGEILKLGEGVIQFKLGDRVACIGAGHALHSNYALVPQQFVPACRNESVTKKARLRIWP